MHNVHFSLFAIQCICFEKNKSFKFELNENRIFAFCTGYLSIFIYILASIDDFRWCSGIPKAEGVEMKEKTRGPMVL